MTASSSGDSAVRSPAEPAAELQDLIGGLLSSLVRAQAQADVTTLAVARAYLKSEQLIHFPLLRASMEVVDIALHVALVRDTAALTAAGRSKLTSLMMRESLQFLDEPPLDELARSHPQLAIGWYGTLPATMTSAEQLLARATDFDAATLAEELLLIKTNAFFRVVVSNEELRNSLGPRLPALLEVIRERKLAALQTSVADLVAQGDVVDRAVRVLYTADQLEGLPPTAVSQVRIQVDPQARRLIEVQGQIRVVPE